MAAPSEGPSATDAPPAIALVAQDLLWQSRIRAAADASGRAVRVPEDLDGLRTLLAEGVVDLVLVDLHHPRTDPLAAVRAAKEAPAKVHVVAYGSHKDVERLRAAREAGADEAVPNSRMEETLHRRLGTL